MSENEMKNACIRLRSCDNGDYKVQNNLVSEPNISEVKTDSLDKYENRIYKLGYKKVFDTIKKDHHYYKEGMNSKIQL